MKSPKRSNKRPVLWVVLLLVLGGIAYMAMDPDMVMRALEPYLGKGEVKGGPPMTTPQVKSPSTPGPSAATNEQLASPPATPFPLNNPKRLCLHSNAPARSSQRDNE